MSHISDPISIVYFSCLYEQTITDFSEPGVVNLIFVDRFHTKSQLSLQIFHIKLRLCKQSFVILDQEVSERQDTYDTSSQVLKSESLSTLELSFKTRIG